MRKQIETQKIHSGAKQAIQNFYPDTIAEIEAAIAKHEWVVIGMTANAFVGKAHRLLEKQNKTYHKITKGSYVSKWQERLAIKMWSGWPTFPQIFHKGILIGGYSDLKKYLDLKNEQKN
jgi:monothiol glutaredoxin